MSDDTDLIELEHQYRHVMALWAAAPETDEEADALGGKQRELEERINLAAPASTAEVVTKLRLIEHTQSAIGELADDEHFSLRQCIAFLAREPLPPAPPPRWQDTEA